MKQLLLLITTLFLFNLTSAQNCQPENWTYIPIDSMKQKWGDWDEPEWLRYFGLDFTDVNRDGLLDVISGRYIYINPGGDMSENWLRITLDDNVDAILTIDVDGDAYADIIAQSLPEIIWLEALNEAGTAFESKVIARVPATGHVNSQGFEKAQVVAGGKEELLIAGNGDIYCISIPASTEGRELWPTHLICKNTSDEGIGVGDIDGDGDLDIACGRRPEGEHEPLQAVWYENPGTISKQWESSPVASSEHPMDRFKVADLNGDGETEIIVTEERYPGLEPDGNMYWFSRKENLKEEWEKHIIVTQYSMNNLDVADIDDDGDLDLITNEHKGPNLELQIWENDGLANFKKCVIDQGKEMHLGSMFVDIDADGDLDIVGAAWDHYQWMHLWRNDKKKALSKVYREYTWIAEEELINSSFLRVGGKIDYNNEAQNFKASSLNQGFISMFDNLDLDQAMGAELILEKVQSHNDTKGLRFKVNMGEWIPVYMPPGIKQKPEQYMHHFSPAIPVPLEDLKPGRAEIKLEVDPEQEWGWPQNIFYGITLRIYYAEEKADLNYSISGIKDGSSIALNQTLGLLYPKDAPINRVEYIGFYEDVNWQGDGVYRQWQYNTHNTGIRNHIGTAEQAPYELNWDNEWLPDQKQAIKVKARVVLQDGLILETKSIKKLSLRRDYSVFLLKPYQVPDNWVTRNQMYSEKIQLPMDGDQVQEAKMYWRSWSPAYSEGITVNGALISYENPWPFYEYMEHTFELDPLYLQEGENTITTLKTALHDGNMVHGMEVQWPGIQVKVKAQKSEAKNSSWTANEVSYEGRPHFRIESSNIIYYYDKAGGGFSRMIDRRGNDWISFKMEPWGEYPAAAASAFRGFPNMVFRGEDGGAGHPGHDKCKSWIEGEKIITETGNGKWKWQWSFANDHVVLEVLKVAEGAQYWVLYEGTPGGRFSPSDYSYGTSSLKPGQDINDYFKGETKHEHFSWIFASSKSAESTFYMAQVNKDDKLDLYGFLGNSEAGLDSPDGMTVFGFGRGTDTNPLLDEAQKFIFGLYPALVNDQKTYKLLSKHIKTLIQ